MNLGEEHIKGLIEAAHKFVQLRYISLAKNNLGADWCNADILNSILRQLQGCQETLECINLDFCNIKASGLSEAFAEIKFKNLKEFRFSGNNLEENQLLSILQNITKSCYDKNINIKNNNNNGLKQIYLDNF